MGENFKNIFPNKEIELIVQNLQNSKIEELGTPLWFENHQILQKLSVKSAIEAKEMKEEIVKDLIVLHKKIPILIYEAICVQVWREKILCQILKLKQHPQNTFIAYSILYHEISVISLLSNILYHKDSVQDLEDVIIDLIDYCATEIVRLLSKDYASTKEFTKTCTTTEEIKSQCETIGFHIGLSAITIIRYVIEYMQELPLAAGSRLYKTHDAPLLIANLLNIAPWKRINPKTNTIQIFEDRTWKNIDKTSRVSKYEGQCWIALRFLLLNLKHECFYELTDYRKQHLLKIQKCLTEKVIDQIPPLLDLKQFLTHLSFTNAQSNNKKPLLMETVPEIKRNILQHYSKNWKKITKEQIELIFCCKRGILMEIAKRLGETYDLNHFDSIFTEGPTCSNCGESAFKRCSKCRNEWYCGRECQVKNWPKHKIVCQEIDGAKMPLQPSNEVDK